MKFLIIFAIFGLLLQVECQGVKGYRNGPAARSRFLADRESIKGERESTIAARESTISERESTIADREEETEIEEAETAVMKLIMNRKSDSDIEEEFHRDQHIKACLGAIDDSVTQVQKKSKQRTIQSGVKGRFSGVDRESEYRKESPTGYQVVATSRSSAIIGPATISSEKNKRNRISSSEGERVTRRRRIQSKTIQKQSSEDFDHCLEPRKVGPCPGSMSRYWYNPTNGMCEEFLYGGCNGNNNNFLTSDHCMDKCHARGSRRIIVEPIEDSITQQAQYQRVAMRPGVKGGYTSSSLPSRSSRRGSGMKKARITELESEELIADQIPITSRTVDDRSSVRSTETIPRTRFSAQVRML